MWVLFRHATEAATVSFCRLLSVVMLGNVCAVSCFLPEKVPVSVELPFDCY